MSSFMCCRGCRHGALKRARRRLAEKERKEKASCNSEGKSGVGWGGEGGAHGHHSPTPPTALHHIAALHHHRRSWAIHHTSTSQSLWYHITEPVVSHHRACPICQLCMHPSLPYGPSCPLWYHITGPVPYASYACTPPCPMGRRALCGITSQGLSHRHTSMSQGLSHHTSGDAPT